MDRRAFIKAMIGGVLYVSNSPRRDFLTGDSMAKRWKRAATDKVALPTLTIQEVERRCRKFLRHSDRHYNTVLVFAGTADCHYPPGQTFGAVIANKYTVAERERKTNTPEKCEQICSDLTLLRDLLVKELDYEKLIVIGPFPTPLFKNFQLIECVDEKLSQSIPEYAILSRDFFDFTNKKRLNESWFADFVHLNKKGYKRLEEVIEARYLQPTQQG